MRLGSPQVLVGSMSLAAVVLMAVVDLERASPGPIASVHARLADLDGGESCAACHGGWFGTMTDACLQCHAPIGAQIEDARGLHGVLGRAAAERCATCHNEHHGPGFALVNRRTFALAGVTDPVRFDHERIGWTMEGRHLELGCGACHVDARTPVLAEGNPRFLGLERDCASCHVDPHEGRMQVACASCHGQVAWEELHSLGHERQLPLVGGHGDVACRACHAGNGPHALETLGEEPLGPASRACAACHASPHTADFAASNARLAGLATDRGCVVCHAAEHSAWRESAAVLSANQHAFSGFALEAPHDVVACADCHDPGPGSFQARHAGRSPDACSACHADPHGGQFATGPFADQECTACHARSHFEPHEFTVEKHALTALALDGRHLEVQCAACHEQPAPGAPRAFHGSPARCEDCHADAHRGFFDERTAEVALPAHGSCELCHTTQGFATAKARAFDHAAWTDFPVLGAHAQGECTACHPSLERADESRRTFGRVEDAFGAFTGCATCHSDPHAGRFDAAGLPEQVAGREGCARCHEETSFRSFPHGFDHGAWTGFALREGHGDAACSACHARLRRADELGRTWGPANGAGCADCHPDPHGGQFEVQGESDCARCHDSDRRDYLAFDHDRDSRFELGEQHRKLDCAACHFAAPHPSGAEVVRYRPLGAECVDCHGVREDVLVRRRRR